MAHEVLCLFNKFGFCKYQDRCRKKHTNEICDTIKNTTDVNLVCTATSNIMKKIPTTILQRI